MFKTRITSLFAVASAIAATVATFAVAPASQNTSTPAASVIESNRNASPASCEGQAWPYQTSACVEEITRLNGRPERSIRVIPVYQPPQGPKALAYAVLATKLRPSN